jgi:arsenate reductase
MTAHWGVPDPAAVRGSQAEIERAFRDAFLILDRRISLFLSLPLETLDRLALKRELDNIGQTSNQSTTVNAAPLATSFER